MNNSIEKTTAIGMEIIKIVQKKLMHEDSVVAEVFHLLKPVKVADDILLESDGYNLFYNEANIVALYKAHKLQQLEIRYMHILLHGLLGHYTERDGYMQKNIIDLVLDFQVENVRKTLKTNKVPNLDNCRLMYEKIKSKKAVIPCEVAGRIHQDEHSLWDMNNKLNALEEQSNISSEERAKKWGETCERIAFTGGSILSEMFKNIYEKKNKKSYGTKTYNNEMVCRAKGQAAGDYYNILKDFFFEKECVNEDINTIDKILYNYGVENYGNIALIEPDEESTKKSLHNIVIAIDTSMSCQGHIERFLTETRDIFKRLLEGIEFESVYIMQADADVTNENQCTNLEEIITKLEENYMTYGYGGTDFRPVFNRCDELSKEGKNIDCLIYFSDGEGCFPSIKPKKYDTFFVMPYTEGNETTMVPEWVKKIHI